MSPAIRFIIGKEPFVRILDEELEFTDIAMRDVDGLRIPRRDLWFQCSGFPRPRIAKPKLRKEVNDRLFGPAIMDSDKHVHVCGIDARVFDKNVKIAVLVENSGVQ